MILNFATKIFGSSNDRQVSRLFKQIDPINALEPHFEGMSDDELKNQTAIFRQRLTNGEPLNNLLPETFAAVREAAKRTLGQRHFDVQLVGGMVLHQGKIAEMKTGEGKTLVATLAAYLNALSGKGVHIVTVNDYLAQRDASWMGQIYGFMGLTTGCITGGMLEIDREKAYAADITYGTNNEFGFDYLRDNMKFQLDHMVQRDFNFAIVDEVDSILIDEARTPLIISGPSESSIDLYISVNKLIPELQDQDYEIDEKTRTIILTEEGNDHLETLLRDHSLLTEGNVYDAQNIALVHHVNQALRAHKIFARDTDYIVKDGKVIIIDEFTGRMMEGRRFSEGLHQALEAKENVAIQNENQTLASITFQNYFRMYPKLAGMTGTAMTEATEFAEIYNLGAVEIPTNVDVARADHDDKIYRSLEEKYNAIVKLISECQERQQPVLVGTVSIEKSEILSDILKKKKIKHNVLNARYHEQEAYIIGQAGQPGAVTIATNMAGRGTDIQLGGNVDMRIEQEIEEDWPEQKKEERKQAIIQEVQKNSDIVKEAGGLYVIGTERHESRRIDNQLRGRSGRQGDPGASVFFLSVEDDLMRIFAADKMSNLLNSNIGLREGEALAHPLLSKALERAQAKVEQQNFEIRKNLLKYDNVMNDQRKVIYEQRKEIMHADDVGELITDMRHDVIDDLVVRTLPPQSYPEQWDTETLQSELHRIFALNLPVKEWSEEEGIDDTIMLERVTEQTDSKMHSKQSQTSPDAYRQIEKSFLLQLLDQHWKEHLLNLDHMRQGINLRAFGQRDPLNEYKAEAFALFEEMLHQLRQSVTQTMNLVEFNVDPRIAKIIERNEQKMQESRMDPAFDQNDQSSDPRGAKASPIRKDEFKQDDPNTWNRIGRNAPCPCGSGKKYKHCHGRAF